MDSGLVKRPSHSYKNAHGLREYRLVIYPDPSVYNKIVLEKSRFAERYETEGVAQSFPHILVTAFHAGEGMEQTLIRWIQRICSLQNSFLVSLNNYSGIPSHTIYLRVQDQQPFRDLSRQLRVIDHYVQFPVKQQSLGHQSYYLSIAGDLPEHIYEKAMPAYSRKTFYASFPVNELVLLARDHPFAIHKTVNVFRFLPAILPLLTGVA
jgi:2'-5' RNA ligase superfamily